MADLIPIMTSNTEPSGVASASSEYSNKYQAWKAMNKENVDSYSWHSDAAMPAWLQYQFIVGKTIKIYSITSRNIIAPAQFYPIAWTLNGSNNGVDWTTLDTQTGQSFGKNWKKYYSFINSTSYTYYRLNITSTSDAGTHACIGEWELSETQILDDLIPTMTSNTEPSGVASASSQYNSSYAAWKAMDKTNINAICWHTHSSGMPAWLQYQYPSGKTIAKYAITSRNEVAPAQFFPINFTLKASNTGAFAGEETTLDTQTGISWAQNEKKIFNFSNIISYTYYRLNITVTSDAGTYATIGEWELMEKGTLIKTIIGLAKASVDTVKELIIASVESINGLS